MGIITPMHIRLKNHQDFMLESRFKESRMYDFEHIVGFAVFSHLITNESLQK
jgi:hypothetical protein